MTAITPRARCGEQSLGLVRLAVARLTKLPVQPWSWVGRRRPEEALAGGADTSPLWVNPSRDTLIAQSHCIASRPPGTGVHFWKISRGRFTPLRVPSSLATSQPGEVAR